MKQHNLNVQWHVIYTRPRAERQIARSIEKIGIEFFLPFYKVERKWSDRKKKIEVPLFPNYIFVRVDNNLTKSKILSVKHVVKFISIDGRPLVVREQDITSIKKILNDDLDVAPENYFHEGMKVRIKGGQFNGFEGVIVKKFNDTRLIISISTLMKAYSFNISSSYVEVENSA